MADPTHIVVRNARTHNLKGVDVAVPRGALVVFTGVSGSGKSSLVFDTIHQEGQRRFTESLSAYARQFLGQMERPEVDAVDGVSPTLSIDQKTVNRNPRSTVGTITEIYDHLRLLFARLGEPRCPICATPIQKLGVQQIADGLVEGSDGTAILVLGPVVQERKGEHRQVIEQLGHDGWVRARIDGAVVRLEDAPELERYKKHTIEVVVDRLVPNEGERSRLVEALESALRLGEGSCRVLVGEEVRAFATARACPNHPEQALPEMEPRLFSFNAPQGACGTCGGLGALERFEPSLVLDAALPVDRAVRALNAEGKVAFTHVDRDALRRIAKEIGADPKAPVSSWTDAQRERLLEGDPELSWRIEPPGFGLDGKAQGWLGLLPILDRVWSFSKFGSWAAWRSHQVCPDCAGARLHPMARSVVFRGQPIHALSAMTVADAHTFFDGIRLSDDEATIGGLLVSELKERLAFLHEVGLGYLSLSRSAATLSGGEGQRIRLASQVGSGLQGVTYVLDEPSIGLHPRDNARLLAAMRRLRDRGNSVLVVEHDAETILAADWVVDVGPGAGRLGGEILASGPPAEVLAGPTATAAWLRGEVKLPAPPRRTGDGRAIVVRDARRHNVQGVDLRVPLGVMTVVTGVSGSGKSTLVFQVLETSLESIRAGGPPVGCAAVEGVEQLDGLVQINQRPIGRTPRSNPATYTGLMDLLRDLFAETEESRARGYAKGRFSFNVPGGRCEACEGAGVKTIEMQFLPDVQVPCEDCEGRRFNRETLEIRWGGRSIADVLALTIGEALDVFAAVPKARRILQTLVDVGLDYVTLGQPSTTLSGGEAQRVKLATELHRQASGHTLYLLDEPTTGLHFEDVAKLLAALGRLVDAGHTVLIVEHHTDVIQQADHLIDLGPEGGDAGGRIIGEGTPEQIARLDSPTGRALAAAMVPVVPALVAAEPEGPWSANPRAIRVTGARKHNLQGVNVEIPHGKMTVVTGPSGSGKTSLAFDTIFAEGQRRYVESLSTYARRFLGRLDRAPVEKLEGLQPAIAIDQNHASHNPRSTVATVTEIHDVLRLLYARLGQPHCPDCGVALAAHGPSQVASLLAAASPGAGWLVGRLPKADDPARRRDALAAAGWQRLIDRRDGVVEVSLDAAAALPLLAGGADLVFDRFDPGTAERSRISEAVTAAYREGDGAAVFVPRRGEPVAFTAGLVCPTHGPVLPELTPRHFSFNSRLGMCPACEGLGEVKQVVPERLLLDDGPLPEALDPRIRALLDHSPRLGALLPALAAAHSVAADAPLRAWPKRALAELLHGRADPLGVTLTRPGGQARQEKLRWSGLMELARDGSAGVPWVTALVPCRACGGGRLAPAILAVTLLGRSIHALASLTVDAALATFDAWSPGGEAAVIAARPREELVKRLRFLSDVGLGYLTLDRAADTLSGGESQRIRLASQLGSGLTGVTYVLDEPTVGLHPRDTARLLRSLEGLRDLGNTVLVVEHDPDTIRRADHVIDLGPAAGSFGGRVMAAGTPAELEANPASGTGRWLSGAERFPVRAARRESTGEVMLEGARVNNLRVDVVSVPLGVWTAVTGVSGSGKSSLIMDTLAPALAVHAGGEGKPAPYRKLTVDGRIDGVVVVDQSPIGRTPRSTPATYVGVFDKIRQLFASTPVAQERGWTPIRFSFNGVGGRCEACEGRGSQLIEMHFLPDVWVRCPECRGKRYSRDTLEARWKGKSIADVLQLRCDEALELFSAQRGVKKALQALVDVGLGYLQLGQPGSELSGGEAQRIKLAAELVARAGHRVYVLDEPTTGLHLSDVARLVEVLHRLVDAGHTVITIEHHLDMIRQADHVLELGPEGGTAGGRIVAEGTPEAVARLGTATGRVL